MRTLGTVTTLAVACLVMTPARSALATDDGVWTFEATPYLFAAGMKGTVGIRGYKAEADMSFGDIIEKLDISFMGLITAKKGRWTMGLEGMYIRMEDSGSTTITGPNGVVSVNGRLDLSNSMSIVQASAGYRVVEAATRLDLIGALRYTKLEAETEIRTQLSPGVVFPGGQQSVSGSRNWTDAVVGMRVQHPVNDTLTLMAYADVGGGGSELTYQLMAGAHWEFAKGYSAKIGYRQLYWDYEEDGAVWDVRTSGPYLGLGISF